jgi:hypothetical protein
MALIKNNILMLVAKLMTPYKRALDSANEILKLRTGKVYYELDPNDWVEADIYNEFMKAYSDASLKGDNALIEIGLKVYPTIQAAGGIPPSITNELELLAFEGEGFLAHHKGSDVVPRKYLKVEPNNVIVEAISPGYDCTFIEGVFHGILQMYDIKDRTVIQKKCVKNGDRTCEYHINW